LHECRVVSKGELNSMSSLSNIRLHFNKPIHEAAACLNMSIQDLKKVCRDNNLKRWPYNGFRKYSPRNEDKESPFQVLFIEQEIKKKSMENVPKKSKSEPTKVKDVNQVQILNSPSSLPSFSHLLESISLPNLHPFMSTENK
jgi:hypothetical protein